MEQGIGKSNHWELVVADELESNYLNITKLHFSDEENGFFVGSKYNIEGYTNNTLISEQDAVLFTTKNGGKDWKYQKFGKGLIFECQQIEDRLIRIYKSVYTGKGLGDFKVLEAFDSKDKGVSWNRTFGTKNDFISISFSDHLTGIGILSGKESIVRNLKYTDDGGKNWGKLKTDEYYFNNNIFIKEDTFCILAKASFSFGINGFDKILKINIKDLTIKIEDISIGKVQHMYIDSTNNVWLIKDGEKKIEVYLREGKNFYLVKKIESESQIFLEEIYSYRKLINILISETAYNSNIYSIVRSEDFGKTWELEELPLKLMVTPSAYYKDKKIWYYSGDNRFQLRK